MDFLVTAITELQCKLQNSHAELYRYLLEMVTQLYASRGGRDWSPCSNLTGSGHY
jgi:hypothetical protein